MKLITRNADYAIRALCSIAVKKNIKVSVDLLVKELDMPKPFLRKILQVLQKKRFLKSFKGQGGGFILAVDASKISLADIVEVFQGKLQLNECTFKKQVCPNVKTCIVKKKIDGIQNYVVKELKDIKISSLLKEQ